MRGEPPSWRIELHDEFDREFVALDADVQENLLAALQAIRLAGAKAGRPYVGTLKGSKHANMKELRFDAHSGTQVWRAAFAFDPGRNAVVLVAGEKQGKNERLFYRRLIAIADARFDAHLGSFKRRSERK
jgi:hypothetical protein